MAQDIKLTIDQLKLDPENPRIEGEESQLDILQAIIDDQGTKLLELASDIAQYQLNPMDRLMVLQPNPKKEEYIALEGNRRAAALQILNNSDILKDLTLPDLLRDKLVELSDNFDPGSVEPIAAVLMPNRESARRWIELRHTGQNDGRGIVDWNGVQTARFRGDKTLQLVDFVKAKGALTAQETLSLGSNFPITTLDRIVSNPVVRQKIGLQIHDGEYYIVYPWEEVLKPLRRIALDLGTKKINVTSVKNKDQQIEYVDSLPPECFPSGAKLGAPLALKEFTKAPPPPPPPPPPPLDPLARKTLIPSSFYLQIANQKAAKIFHELRTLNVDKYPVAGAVLLRCFVEATVEVYCSKHGIKAVHTAGKNQGKKFSLAEKVNAVIKHLGPGLTNQERTAIQIALNAKDSVISIGRLNEYVHNPAVFPSKNDLVGSWSGVEPFFEGTWK